MYVLHEAQTVVDLSRHFIAPTARIACHKHAWPLRSGIFMPYIVPVTDLVSYIEVIPRQITVDGESTERTPLAESHTRGNQARRARTASHVQGMPFTSSTLSMINS
jgi:hypothetical protein